MGGEVSNLSTFKAFAIFAARFVTHLKTLWYFGYISNIFKAFTIFVARFMAVTSSLKGT